MGTSHKVDVYFDGLPESNGEVYLDDLTKLCDQVGACLRVNEEAITKSKPKARYQLSNLEKGSISLSIVPSQLGANEGVTSSTISLFNQTVDALQNGAAIDSRLGYKALQAYKRLAETFLKRSSSFRLSDIKVTTRFVANIEDLLDDETSSEGSFKGRIERYNIHNRNECALYSPLRDEGIDCSFDKELRKQVHAAIDHSVTVNGTLYFYGSSAFPTRIHIKKVQIHPDDKELPKLSSLAGLVGDKETHGLSVKEFINMVRNG